MVCTEYEYENHFCVHRLTPWSGISETLHTDQDVDMMVQYSDTDGLIRVVGGRDVESGFSCGVHRGYHHAYRRGRRSREGEGKDTAGSVC
ncbi:protein of unknown function [Candidatus Filomicrobium marinum]|uniref:Uncharacterized protein n=1 Tax=Candidatus Filomicrobium marinum TaxID=1608628 RepID=A0A0D6JB61_9HYPH|nr:protein of unknown function [Candidatus Filomicrobium marinum]CPR16229.1 protein of unknown function [Candidatus Filomicrobium marinum]